MRRYRRRTRVETAPERDVCEIEIVVADEPPEIIGGQRVIDSWPAEVKKALDARGMFVMPCYQHKNCVDLRKYRGRHCFARLEFTPLHVDLGALWLQDELESHLARWDKLFDMALDAEEARARAKGWEV